MTVEQAKREVEKHFIRATKMKHIQNPLAWALYQVWKMADAEKSSSCKKDGENGV